MGKRSDLGEKRPRDFWPTVDPDAVKPLIPHVWTTTFAEPCCGDGSLVHLIERYIRGLKCEWTSDIEPPNGWASQYDALDITKEQLGDIDYIITNPPFSWNLLEPLLKHLPTLKPTWLLLPADCIHNRRMAPYMEKCHKIVSVGRLYWMENKVKGVDNYVWLLWDYNKETEVTEFIGRT